MSDSSLFLAAALPWLRQIDEDGAREIFERLDSVLLTSEARSVITVRGTNVLNSRREWVMTAAEPLSRWDSRPPTEIFRTGLLPRSAPESMDDFRTLDVTRVDLNRYVRTNVRSIFISTTRFVMEGRRQSGWFPTMTSGRYQYEIFAYGGIDVQATFRLYDDGLTELIAEQQEVTFVGGIRPGLIRSAREYDSRGRVVRTWRNLHFNPLLNREFTPRPMDLPRLPNIVDTANFLIVDPPDDEGEDMGQDVPGHDELRRSVDANEDTSEDDDVGDLSTYKLTEDPWAVDNVPVFPLARACTVRQDSNQAYFFADTRFVRIDLQIDDNLTDTIGEGGVQNIVSAWSSLHKAHFSIVDAVLLNPVNIYEAYFFSNDKYALIDINSDEIILGPKTIIDEWPSLQQVGFSTIDAVLPIYYSGTKAYFFRRTEYVRVVLNPGTNDDYVEVGRTKIVNGWPSLKEAGFDTIDAILPSPRSNSEVYFFKGDKYVLVNVDWSTYTDTLVFQPRLVKEHWPSLVQARFY